MAHEWNPFWGSGQKNFMYIVSSDKPHLKWYNVQWSYERLLSFLGCMLKHRWKDRAILYWCMIKAVNLLSHISLPGRWLNLVVSSHNATVNHHCPGLCFAPCHPTKVNPYTRCSAITCVPGRCFPSTVLPSIIHAFQFCGSNPVQILSQW